MSKLIGAVLFLTLFTLAACRGKDSHISPEEMAPIVADLHIADAYSGLLRDTAQRILGKNYDSLAVWTKSILTRHHVTQQQFNQSMDWYRDRPVELDSLYARVIPILEKNRK
jgi:hypothetical protein